jgi:hypothetical protein
MMAWLNLFMLMLYNTVKEDVAMVITRLRHFCHVRVYVHRRAPLIRMHLMPHAQYIAVVTIVTPFALLY